MLASMFTSLIETVFGFFTVLLLARSWMIAHRLPFRHPLGEFIRLCTGWLTKPFESRSVNHTRFVLVPLFLAWIAEFASLQLVEFLARSPFAGPDFWWRLALVATIKLLSKALLIVIVTITLQALLSWVNPFAPVMFFLTKFTAPLLKPLRRLTPTIGAIDFSPMIAILVCFVLYRVLTTWHQVFTVLAMNWYRIEAAKQAIVLTVHVQPNAKTRGVVGLHGDAVKIRLTSPPVDGKANSALLAYLADSFAVPLRQVSLESGHQSRRKRVRIEGVDRLPPMLSKLIIST